jgi:hypothetical protein
VGGQHHTQAAFTLGKDPVPIVQEAENATNYIGKVNKNTLIITARSRMFYILSHIFSSS